MTEEQLMSKMRGSAGEYRELIHNRQYVRAINLYNKVRAVAVYVELPADKLEELFGRYDPEDKNAQNGLFDQRSIVSVADRAFKQEIEENRKGNPTQIRDFEHYLPRSYFRTK